MYTYIGNAAATFVDLLGLDEFKAVCGRRDERDTLIFRLQSANRRDLRLAFFKTQSCILNKLCHGSCCGSGDSTSWINGVVDKFMGNLLDAMNNNFYDDNQVWQQTFAQIRTYQGALDTATELHYSDGRDAAVIAATVSGRYQVSQAMVLTHINNDLRQVLEANGVGHGRDWGCIGDVVRQCSQEVFSEYEITLGEILFGFDVDGVRDAMRHDVFMNDPKRPVVILPSPEPRRP